MTAFALTPLGRLMYDLGPIHDGVFTNLLPILGPTAPTELLPTLKRTTRPLAVRIAEEEARLARRLDQHAAAGAALARIPYTIPDRAAAMLRADLAYRQNQRMDAALARYAAAQRRVDVTHSRVVMSRARLSALQAQEVALR